MVEKISIDNALNALRSALQSGRVSARDVYRLINHQSSGKVVQRGGGRECHGATERTVSIPCAYCSGSGSHLASPCPVCRGVGQVIASANAVSCGYCRGTGSYLANLCPVCCGVGKATIVRAP